TVTGEDPLVTSLTLSSSTFDSWPPLAPGVSVMLVVERVNVPATSPLLVMTTVPLVGSPPGSIFVAVRTAAPSLELDCARLPALNVLLGFADFEVKLAPDPTTAPNASSATRSAPSRWRG